MARFRRKSCITLIALVLLLLIITVVLKSLTPEDYAFSSPVGIDLFPDKKNDNQIQKDNKADNKPDQTKMKDSAQSNKDGKLEATLRRFPPPNYYLHAFYYTWYGNPNFDGKYIHWDHPQLPHWDFKVAQGYPQGRHIPPDDIGSNFYPALGAYSSRDPSVVEAHMQQLRTAAIGKTEINLIFTPGLDNNSTLSSFCDDIMLLQYYEACANLEMQMKPTGYQPDVTDPH